MPHFKTKRNKIRIRIGKTELTLRHKKTGKKKTLRRKRTRRVNPRRTA